MYSAEYNWNEYSVGFTDGVQDRKDGKYTRYIPAIPYRADIEYWDGYLQGLHGGRNKADTRDVPNGCLEHTPEANKNCRFKLMGDQWLDGVIRYAVVHGLMQIGWQVDYFDGKDTLKLNMRMVEVEIQ